MAAARTCERCNSAVCSGRLERCMGCGIVQCHGNGLGNGCCKVCHYGILPGWSGSSGQCSYKGCAEQGVFRHVRGKAYVCRKHASQAKIKTETLEHYAMRNAGEVIMLAQGGRKSWRLSGIVAPRPGIDLASGRRVIHVVELSGAQRAVIAGEPSAEMTPEEWDEYCRAVRAESELDSKGRLELETYAAGAAQSADAAWNATMQAAAVRALARKRVAAEVHG